MAIQVAYSELDSWLQSQPENSKSNPYKLEITGLTPDDVTRYSPSLGSILRKHNEKYVDLSATSIPSGTTSLYDAFSSTHTIVKAPKIPDSVTNMKRCFYYCTSLEYAFFPNYVTDIEKCFDSCWSMKYYPIYPETVISKDRWKPSGGSAVRYAFAGTEEQVKRWINNPLEDVVGCNPEDTFVLDDIDYTNKGYGVFIDNLEAWLSINSHQTFGGSIINGPGDVYIFNLTTSNVNMIKSALLSTLDISKKVSLAHTVLPNITNMASFFEGCSNLVESPQIPLTVTNMNSCFKGCTKLKNTPSIPNSVTNMISCFFGCTSITTSPNIPNAVTNLENTFNGCTSLLSVQNIPSNVTILKGAFKNCKITSIPSIPDNVTNMDNAFENTPITNVSKIPNLVTSMKECFKDCIALTKIDTFAVPLSTLKNNTNFQNAFQNCSSLRQIGSCKTDVASQWHVFSLKINSGSFSGKIYDTNGNSVNIPSTNITRSTLSLPNLTDEILFPPSALSDANLETLIQNVIASKYTWYKKTTLNPNAKNFVLWADDPNNVTTNVGGNIEYPIPVDKGGTGQTTQANTNKAIIANLTEGTSNVTDGTMFVSSYASDNGFADSNAVNVPYKRKFITVWNYIKTKIQSIALTIGTTSSAIAETLYGSLTVKNSSGTTTASISQAGAITGTSATISGNVLGSNVPYFGAVYSSNTYNSGYFLLAQLEGTGNGNHDVSMSGVVYYCPSSAGSARKANFWIIARGNYQSVTVTKFLVDNVTVPIFATYEAVATNKFIIRLYGQISANYQRFNTVIEFASTGDVFARVSNRTVTFPNTQSSALTGTSITVDRYMVTNANSARSLSEAVTCSTAGGTAAKTVDLSGFVLVRGAKLIVNLQNANTVASALTLNVNGTGAKTIRWNGTATSSSTYAMTATQYNCYYDGTYWNMESVYEARNARSAGWSDGASYADYTRGNAYCTTASGTQAKVVSMRGYVLAVGAFPITFTNANSYNGKITLNINSVGAKDLWINGEVTSTTNKTLPAGTYMCFYDGTKYMIDTRYGIPMAHIANAIRTSAPASPQNGDIWIE